MGDESEHRGRFRLTLTINRVHFSPIRSEDEQIYRAFRLRRKPFQSGFIFIDQERSPLSQFDYPPEGVEALIAPIG